ncbi:conserved hypothetical protein [Gloeothece citriformis PCC 7424]|uniref:Uncharacterized protein n=1 Tax=Gloeothece citriformis (strain PCC 7424) TaxID=65393 RepID=B7K9Z4_GLOC7|nr:hypothetical protein [Gloeothece citriformis]ACK71350.1 conserved hypothetical protein [Gloeothece citriformis PCC 7424]
MILFRRLRTTFITLSLVLLLLVTTTACGGSSVQAYQSPTSPYTNTYSQLERGNTSAGQNYGNWVVQTAQGMIQDAYVRDNDKLGVVISPDVRPHEVRPLAKSLLQGFEKNFPNHDLTVLVYAPDKKLILTAKYNNLARQVEYQ